MSPVFHRESNTANISASVLMINGDGIMLSVCGQDYFLSYNRIPWMRDASINHVLDVRMSINEQLRNGFYNNTTIASLLPGAEQSVLDGQKTSFVAAKQLLDTYFALLH